MSGIAGLYRFEREAVDRLDVRAMASAMAHRGPDGSATWVDGSVGLAHCMLHTTPESLHEQLPFSCAASGMSITCDARIDNRDELLGTLGIDDAATPDSLLILAAYRAWGEACVDHLLGDYVFAIWDGAQRHLFLACDHFAVKQLFYYLEPGKLFAFASEIKALLALPELPVRICDEAVAEYLVPELLDAEKTVFEGIRRLMPAHVLRVDASGCRSRRYWTLQPASIPQDLSDEEYAARFSELLETAVRCRLRSAYPVGSELSGGLDSSVVTCLARRMLRGRNETPLHTFSTVYDTLTECDERPYIRAVLEKGDLEPHFCVADREEIVGLLDEIFGYVDDGRVAGNHYLNWITAREAGQAGVRVLLTGQDGDSTVSHGLEYFYELARAGRWERFAAEARAFAAHLREDGPYGAGLSRTEISPLDVVDGFAGPYLRDWAREGRYLKLGRALWGIQKHFRVPARRILRKLRPHLGWPGRALRGRGTRPERPTAPSIVAGHLAERAGLSKRLETMARREHAALRSAGVREKQLRSLTQPHVTYTLGTFAQYGAANGVELRHPFMDKRLVEYCLGLPPQQSLSNGWTRSVLRRAMVGVVPDAITWRPGKTDLTAQNRSMMYDTLPAEVREKVVGSKHTARFVDRATVRGLAEKGARMSAEELQQWSKAVSLSLWLEKRHQSIDQTRTISAPLSAV